MKQWRKHENRIASCVSPRHAANPHVNTQIRSLSLPPTISLISNNNRKKRSTSKSCMNLLENEENRKLLILIA